MKKMPHFLPRTPLLRERESQAGMGRRAWPALRSPRGEIGTRVTLCFLPLIQR